MSRRFCFFFATGYKLMPCRYETSRLTLRIAEMNAMMSVIKPCAINPHRPANPAAIPLNIHIPMIIWMIWKTASSHPIATK